MNSSTHTLTVDCDELISLLVADHTNALVAYIESMLRDRSMAQDVVQETMIRAWRHCERLQPQSGSLRAWLQTVARNLAVDHVRSAWSRHERVGAEVAEPDHVDLDPADVVVDAAESLRLLRDLSDEHREVLRLTLLEDLSLEQASDRLGVPVGTVKSRRHYALAGLRSRLRHEPRGLLPDDAEAGLPREP